MHVQGGPRLPRRSPGPLARAPRGQPRDVRPYGTSASSLDLARLELSELLLERLSQLEQECRGRLRLLLVDLRHGEADVDQDPVADVDRVWRLGQKPDVHVAAHAGDVRLRDVV